MLQDWINNVSSSPYYSQIQAQNFNSYPLGMRRTWIYPVNLTATGDSCNVFITNSTLGANYVWDNIYLDLSPYSFDQTIVNDLNMRLEGWKLRHLRAITTNITNTTLSKINNAPEYEELRRAATSLAIAQWYKTQPREKIPYGEIIDSNNITGLNIGFDESYWNNQALQYLYRLDNGPSFIPGEYRYWDWYGGVELTGVNPRLGNNITNSTRILIENATSSSYVKENKTIYFSTIKEPEKPDLTPIAIGFSALTEDANKTVNMSILISNKGKLSSGSFGTYFYYEYTYINGFKVQRNITKKEVSNLPVNNDTLITFLTNFTEIGEYKIIVSVDINNSEKEINELNNNINATINIISPYPTANLFSPQSGQQFKKEEIVTLFGIGNDEKEGELNELYYNWTSSKDGYLGNGSVIYTNLSLGDHVIYLTVRDSDGYNNTDRVLVSVVPSTPPTVSLNSPKNNQVYKEGEVIYFSGKALDHEDGNLSRPSLVWNSSINGTFAIGESVNTTNLGVGIHIINLIATDYSAVTVNKSVILTIQESTPTVTLNLPLNGTTYYYTQNITFNATSNDAHEGDLSNKINWTSNVNNYIGIGSQFLKILSPGYHTINAFIKDSNGLTNLARIYLTVLEPQPPRISIITPNNNQRFTNTQNITFRGTGNDPETGSLTGNSLIWNSSINNNFGNGTEINTNILSIGTHNITLIAKDIDNMTTKAVITIIIESKKPELNMINPLTESSYRQGETISFNSTGTDYEDGTLVGNSLKWYSDNTQIGTGTNFSINNLDIGTHVITLNTTDSHGMISSITRPILIVGFGNTTLTTFREGTSIQNLTYGTQGQLTTYVRIPRGANITSATLQIEGLING